MTKPAFRKLDLSHLVIPRLCADLSDAFGRRIVVAPLIDVLPVPEAAKDAREIISVPGLAILLSVLPPRSTDFADSETFRRGSATFVRSPFDQKFVEAVGSVHLAELELDIVGANAFHRIAGSILVPPTLTLGEIFNSLE